MEAHSSSDEASRSGGGGGGGGDALAAVATARAAALGTTGPVDWAGQLAIEAAEVRVQGCATLPAACARACACACSYACFIFSDIAPMPCALCLVPCALCLVPCASCLVPRVSQVVEGALRGKPREKQLTVRGMLAAARGLLEK